MSTSTPTTAIEPISVTELGARSILDSRGFPTLEVRGTLADGTELRAAAPAGASTGEHEAVELRDGGSAFSGRGVNVAITRLDDEIAPLITGRRWSSIDEVDGALAELDGTSGYRRLGANAVVAVSILATRAFAHAAGQPLHTWISTTTGADELLPVPHFNVLNGGAHAANALDFQEFMIAPVGAATEREAVDTGAEVYHVLRALVADRFGTAGLGDEGGFAPPLADPREALDLLVEAIVEAGRRPGTDDVAIALDPAANGFSLGDGRYRVGDELSRDQLVDYYLTLLDDYPIRSLEDGFAEDDGDGWTAMGEALRRPDGSWRVQTVGDDLYVTDPARIRAGAEKGWSDAVLIKPNQIGTVSQTFAAVATARELGMAAMVSHRSGETVDTFIADLVVGTGVGQIKSGAPARGERVAKYNRLTEIELDRPGLRYGLA
ncbi:MAG: phosphopyruvate hydratase [Gordonia sp. (in: high G+C Gram-positive bacteria)]|uniref:phosphopyruvate hydratase n=1 Tax=Gordonia sp. (in: high G+C Gram-positive bacteria) TaxID=84139 RepID=UPI0039E576DD